MIDRELVTRKLVLIASDLDRLGTLAARPAAEYLADPVHELVAERLLERVVGRMIDINYHVLTESGEPPPRDYYDLFTDLAKLRMLPADFAARIAACAGLRNRIAHEYDEIDPARIHEALQAAVTDILEYVRAVRAFIDRLD